jgi:Family of unknown function (DUF6335)
MLNTALSLIWHRYSRLCEATQFYSNSTLGNNLDEAVGGSTAVASQNDPEKLAAAAGIVVDDDMPLATEEMLNERDRDRWELDPASAGVGVSLP